MSSTFDQRSRLAAVPSVPAGLTENDAQRARDLRRMKILATGLLLCAAAIYFVMRWLEHRDGQDVAAWVGYVRATAEAGMVGALADWFAVTALFRQPLGLPIPHTALIPRKKDQIGEQLGGFIQENFMTRDVIEGRVRALDLPRRVSTWFADPANKPRVNDEVSRVFKLWSEMLRDEDVERFIQAVLKWAAEPVWAPPAGRILEQLVAEDRLEPVIQLACDRAHDWALGSSLLIDRVVDRDGPAWAPKFVNHLVGDKIYRELTEFTYKVRSDPRHELRIAMHDFIADFAQELQHDDATIAKFEGLKDELLGRDEITGAASTAWQAGKAVIEQMLDDPESTLRTSLSDAVVQLAERIRDDEPLQAKMNGWTVRAARHVAENYSPEIISVITETVRSWDAEETSRKIELQVGRDLQFIRINGTVVGSLAGLTIYTVSVLLFS
ncbi:membrane protein [Gordonia phthalatica]|uniref:Membrane protein n=2 Tax=Gordonia phthalatica TaxID=1136941 RepID=A0A0N9N9D8_9ACTN|nr:membrane protein [Gordonia phthalatica]